MKLLDDIMTDYENGKYTYHSPEIPAKVSKDHVFDENLTIKENRERIRVHNAMVDRLRKENYQKQNELYAQMRSDVIAYLVDEYGFTQSQAEKVESFTFIEKHSYMHDYFNAIDTFAQFADEVLKV